MWVCGCGVLGTSNQAGGLWYSRKPWVSVWGRHRQVTVQPLAASAYLHQPYGTDGGDLNCGLLAGLCLSCSKTFGTYEIKQYNRGKRAEAEQLMQAAAALTAAAAAPKADENSNAQQAALVRSIC